MFSSDDNFLALIQELKSTLNLTNYDVLSQKGLSTAFTRSFMKHSSANGSLSTIQEMSGGIVKRGLVDVVVEKNGTSESIFSVSIFIFIGLKEIINYVWKSFSFLEFIMLYILSTYLLLLLGDYGT